MTWFLDDFEREQVEELIRRNPSILRALGKDKTSVLLDNLKNRFNGVYPRNFVLNIRGLVGSPSGVFKSALGLYIARLIDPSFNVSERLAMSPSDLNDKIRKFADKKQVFFLDEQPHDLKFSERLKLFNTIESCRENQICFITCGIPKEWGSFSNFTLERFCQTPDELQLNDPPVVRVKYLLSDPSNDLFYGFVNFGIPPLKVGGVLTDWGVFWREYSELKQDWQDRVKGGLSTAKDYDSRLEEFFKVYSMDDYVKVSKSGGLGVNKGKLKLDIKRFFPDDTNDDREILKFGAVELIEKKKLGV